MAEGQSGGTRLLRRLARDRVAVVGLGLVTTFVVAALAAPLLAPHDPTTVDAARRLAGSSLEHPLGTDHLGRDVLSRLLYGAQLSLGTVALATVMILCIGVLVGVVAGYYGGLLDETLMRVVDVLLAFPGLVLALAVAGILGPAITSVIVGLVGIWWAGYARIVRGMVLSLREQPFVDAARCLGVPDRGILLRHILPNVLPAVVVLATLEMGELILALTALGFLGLGAQPPTPEWGAMLNDGRSFLFSAPRLMIYPGLAISLLVIGFNLLGDALRDALDPRLHPALPRVRPRDGEREPIDTGVRRGRSAAPDTDLARAAR